MTQTRLITPQEALPGRQEPMLLVERHRCFDLDLRVVPPGCETVYFGLGCFWGAERLFWNLSGVANTAVGYQGGYTPNPTYEEVCSGGTGHVETVRVAYDPERIRFQELLKTFWEAHDPTQGMRQGNDLGTQYRSCIYPTNEGQFRIAAASRANYEASLSQRGFSAVTTELKMAPPFYFAEGYHQQYLNRNPGGYCGLKGTGVACAIG